MRSHAMILAAAAVTLFASAAVAQDDDGYDHDHSHHYHTYGLPRSYLGGELAFAEPQGEFGSFIDNGWGGGVHYLLRADEDGWLGLRVDASLINYGHERQRVLLSPTVGGRIGVDLTTDNNIAFVGVGPQLGLPTGAFRPYVNGFVGVSYIFTESSVRGRWSDETFASTTNFDDASFAYGGGAGLYIPVSRRSRNPVSIDAGVQYRHNGRADYLVEGGIVDNDDGSITLEPIRSQTNLFAFHVGVSVGVR